MSCFSPNTQQELSEWIIERVESHNKIHWLNSLGQQDDIDLKLSGLNQRVDYPHRDMTITVEAGMTVSALQSELQKHNQWLPVNVPYPQATTLAEVICRNWYGSFVAGYGTMRDWLLGVTAIDGRGRIFHAGGRVVKNVAGYDLCKLLVGSDGELAIPVEVTLQVKPQPQKILCHHICTHTIGDLKKLWQILRDLPFNPVIFDVIHKLSPDETSPKINSPQELQLLFAVQGSQETTGSLTEVIQQTVTQMKGTELLKINSWNPEQETWSCIEEHLLQSTVLRVGSLPSQTIDVMEIANSHQFTGFAHASIGTCILCSLSPPESSEANTRLELLLKDLAPLNVNIQSLSSSKSDRKLPNEQSNQTSALPLLKKIKAEFDPHQLLGDGL